MYLALQANGGGIRIGEPAAAAAAAAGAKAGGDDSKESKMAAADEEFARRLQAQMDAEEFRGGRYVSGHLAALLPVCCGCFGLLQSCRVVALVAV